MIHAVPRGFSIRRRKGHTQLVEHSSRRIHKRYAPPSADAPIPNRGSGWITYAWWRSQDPIVQLTTQWIVPPQPSVASEQTIFLFNALEDDQKNDLLQPVLQWGVSQAGGGHYWAIANWYVDQNGEAWFTELRPVEPGAILTGIMKMSAFNGTTYGYTSYFEGHDDIRLTVNNIRPMTWASQALEAYQIDGVQDYPPIGSTSMSSIAAMANNAFPGVNWQAVNAINNCGEYTTVPINANPGGRVDIVYT
jgi:hypothetical protein